MVAEHKCPEDLGKMPHPAKSHHDSVPLTWTYDAKKIYKKTLLKYI